MTEERRNDPETRKRLQAIKDDYRRYATRTTCILVAIFIVLAAGGFVVTRQQWRTNDLVAQNQVLVNRVTAVVKQIQAERKRNTFSACDTANHEHAAIVGFVTSLVPKPRRADPQVKQYLALAAHTFPQTNCAADVREKVKGSKP